MELHSSFYNGFLQKNTSDTEKRNNSRKQRTSDESTAIYRKNIKYRNEGKHGHEAIVLISEMASALLGCIEFKVKVRDSLQHKN